MLSFNKNSSQNKIVQRQPPRGIPRKMCSEKMQQISRRTTMLCAISIKLLRNFIEIALRHRCRPVNLLHIFRTSFPKNTSRWLLLIHRKQPSGSSNLLSKITDKPFRRKSKFERELITDQSVYILHNVYFCLVLTQGNLRSFNSILTKRQPNNIPKQLSFISRSFMCVF